MGGVQYTGFHIAICFCVLQTFTSEAATALTGNTCAANATCTLANTFCTTNTCQCLPTHFAAPNKTSCVQKITVNGICKAGDSNQCIDLLAECRDDNGLYKCLCKDKHYQKDNNCAPQIAVNDPCEVSDSNQCADPQTECRDGNGYSQRLVIRQVYKCIKVNVACVTVNKGCIQHAFCNSSSICQCRKGYSYKGGACAANVTVGSTCKANGDCSPIPNAVCNTTCQCSPHYFVPSSNKAKCLAKIAVNAVCNAKDKHQCKDINAECKTSNVTKCLCKDAYYLKGTACTTRSGVSKISIEISTIILAILALRCNKWFVE